MSRVMTSEVKSGANEPIRIDTKFKNIVLKTPGGETLKICFQCGTCTSSCPIAKISDSYRPNQIIRLAQFGAKDKVLSSKTLWLCAACYTCVDRCPQGVEMESVIRTLKNLAAKEGYIPKIFKDLGLTVLETGFLYRIQQLRSKSREEKGLPPLPNPKIEDVKKLADKTGFATIIGEESA